MSKWKRNCQEPPIKHSYLSIGYITSYGNPASQQTNILLPNRFTILQPPPPLAAVLVLGELAAVVDALGAGLGLVVEGTNPGILSG